MAPSSLLLSESEFAAIEATVMETDRGRAFLAEFARRRRADDAARVLAAIDRLETRVLRGEVERTRQRLESERAAEVVRQLADVLKELRPIADARLRVNALAAREATEPPRAKKTGGLEHRFAALVQLDEQDLERGLKQFG